MFFALMTTSHRDEAPDEALGFAFYNAHAPDDLEIKNYGSPIVVIVESCSDWIAENIK